LDTRIILPIDIENAIETMVINFFNTPYQRPNPQKPLEKIPLQQKICDALFKEFPELTRKDQSLILEKALEHFLLFEVQNASPHCNGSIENVFHTIRNDVSRELPDCLSNTLFMKIQIAWKQFQENQKGS
jgi:hypothetical protein